MTKKNVIGKLLVANPNNPIDGLEKSVILLVNQNSSIAVGLQLNNPGGFPLKNIFEQAGLWYDHDSVVYIGGNINQDKLHVVHSLDWQSMTTIQLNDQIGITNDYSVLTAITNEEGPSYFRACAGFYTWNLDQLAEQLNNKSNSNHKWEIAPATLETIFGSDLSQQWNQCLQASGKEQINNWFNPFLG